MNLGSASALAAVEMNTRIQLCNRFRPVLVVCKAHFVSNSYTGFSILWLLQAVG